MRSESYMKKLFIVGAFWNWIAAAIFIAIAVLNKEILSLWYNRIPQDMMWYYMCFIAVAIFGLGYYWISRDIERNRDIIKLGIIGKLCFFGFFVIYKLKGEITMMGLSSASGDLIFAALFADVLRRLPQKKTSALQNK